MAIIPQRQLFSWKEIGNLADLERFSMLLKYLPDEKLMKNLESRRKRGRDDYPVRAIWNSILAGIVYQHASVESLRRELMRNAQLRQLCGFDLLKGLSAIPSSNAYTNFLNSIAVILVTKGKFDQALGYYRRSIKIDPNQFAVLHDLARIQDTRPSLPSRNIAEAIMLAERLCKRTNYQHPNALDTLATVYAAAGKFPLAIETAQKAIDVATSANNTKLAQEIAARLKLYKQSMPYTHPPVQ